MTTLRPWYLTQHAERALVEIAGWTVRTFGPQQAASYEQELLRVCKSIAGGSALIYDCSALAGPDAARKLSFARAGRHFVIFAEIGETIVILDFLHERVDLPAKLALLADAKSRAQG